jgi:hypothetical protein
MKSHIHVLVILTTIFYSDALSVLAAFQNKYGKWEGVKTVTLFVRDNVKDENYGKSQFSFEFDLRSGDSNGPVRKDWDIKFGYITIDDSSDYFGVTMISDDRSRVKDLGKMKWEEIKNVPILPANPGPYKGIRFPIPPTGEPIEKTSEGQVTKAVKGHMYIAHIKDPDTDLYVLFRVEDLKPNDRCVISWKIVPSPEV